MGAFEVLHRQHQAGFQWSLYWSHLVGPWDDSSSMCASPGNGVSLGQRQAAVSSAGRYEQGGRSAILRQTQQLRNAVEWRLCGRSSSKRRQQQSRHSARVPCTASWLGLQHQHDRPQAQRLSVQATAYIGSSIWALRCRVLTVNSSSSARQQPAGLPAVHSASRALPVFLLGAAESVSVVRKGLVCSVQCAIAAQVALCASSSNAGF
jgi:hypothetical protein